MRALKLLACGALASVALAACGDNLAPPSDLDAAIDTAMCVPVDDNNDCTTDVCEGGVPVHNPIGAGTTCAGGVCDGAGACVGCLEDNDCTLPQHCDEPNQTCVDPSCTDGEQNGTETAIDCGGSCAPAHTCDNGAACQVPGDCTSGVCTGMICQVPACGDGVQQMGEACDDGNHTNGDGCDDGTGGTCRPTGCGNGTVSGTEACDDGNATNGDGCDNNCTVTACGNGITAGTEACDDGGTATGDGCSDTCTVEAGYTCAMQPSVCTTTCGDGVRAGTEACDDGGTATGDGCSDTCTVETGYTCTGSGAGSCTAICGDGLLLGAEQCDDGGTATGDGCSGTCTFEFTCGTGQTLVQLSNTTDLAIPDNTAAGVDSTVTVPLASQGAVRSVRVGIGRLDHTFDGDVTLALRGPSGRTRNLIVRRGSSGHDFITTRLDDAATTAVTAGTAPFTGAFRPEQTLSDAAGFLGQNALAQGAGGPDGTWTLHLADTASGDTGTLRTWTLGLCVDTTVRCGNGAVDLGEECDDGNTVDTDACSNNCTIVDGCGDGNLDAGELCDDDNIVSGDGCSATCGIDITCGPGQTLVQVANTTVTAIPDNNPTGINSTVTVATTGSVRQAGVLINHLTHTFDGDLDMFLLSPAGRSRELSTDNGSGGDNYVGTLLLDSATAPITGGTAPFTGLFRPETTLSTTAGTDFLGLNAAGTWTLRVVDDAGGDTGTLDAWVLGLCVDAAAGYCGDGAANPGEQCDDGNAVDNDACSNLCQLNCGNGTLQPGEQCDDGNPTPGDGCSATCQVDIGCAAGQTALVLDGTGPVSIPDNDPTGATSTVAVAATGAVTKAAVFIGSLTHTRDDDLDLFVVSPRGNARELSTDNGGSGANYTRTYLDDGATALVTAGTAPLAGRFRPEQTLSSLAGADFLGAGASGTWTLRVADDTATNTGTLDAWKLALCVDPAGAYCGDGTTNGAEQCDDGNAVDNDGCSNLCRFPCGNGIIDPGEQCDDGNLVSGDGCSDTCAVDITCAAGELPVIVSNLTSTPIPDNNATGAQTSVTVASTGAVTKAVVFVPSITHPADADLDLFLRAPRGVTRELSTDNGGAGSNYRGTYLDDAAATAVTAGTAPFAGHFRPEQSLATTAGTDLARTNPAGTWTLQVADDTAGNTGTLDGWYLTLCVDPAAGYCGDGAVNGAEACDDGNSNDNDACSNLCQLNCGNGVINAGEECDDGNRTDGDLCSAACAIEITCAAGETRTFANNNASFPIPDNNATGITSAVTIAAPGAVTKVAVLVRNLTHTFDADLDMFLVGPRGLRRELSTDNGSSGDNYVRTLLDDGATALVTGGTAPFTGRFKPEVTLSTTAGTDFRGTAAAGTWGLSVADDATGDTGTLTSWALVVCSDPAATFCGDGATNGAEQCDDGNLVDTDACDNTCRNQCGNGVIVAGEQCDDGNATSGDGCSATCQVDITCAAGQTPVVVGNTTSAAIPDNNPAGVLSPVTVATTGAVTKAVVYVTGITHPADGDIDMFLRSPRAVSRELSTDNGTGANYRGTGFDDAATTAITAGTSPFTGRFRPETTLSTTAGTDFRNSSAAGTWNLQVADDTAGNTGSLDAWYLALCVDPAATFCGDGVTNGTEQCDDGNTVDTDACDNSCRTQCGNGVVVAGEQCDDGNTTAGDGCGTTCQADIACGAGETPVIVSNLTATAIPDNAQGGVLSTITVPTAGVVRRVIPIVSATHGNDGHLDMWLVSPYGTQRELSTDNGTGANYRSTIFSDTATPLITAGASPFTGAFRPEQTISNAAGFATQTANGTWALRIADDTSGTTGSLDGWTLELCVDTSVTAVCGNGYVEPGETCDDANAATGDGCTACQVELTCATGAPVFVRSTDTPKVIIDNDLTGVTSAVSVAAAGTVTKAVVVIDGVGHAFDGDVRLSLTSPAATTLALITNRGSGGDDFVSTILDDAATTAISTITSAGAPFRGRFRPEAALSVFNTQAAAGAWTLRAIDSASTDGGVLNGWTLGLCVQ